MDEVLLPYGPYALVRVPRCYWLHQTHVGSVGGGIALAPLKSGRTCTAAKPTQDKRDKCDLAGSQNLVVGHRPQA